MLKSRNVSGQFTMELKSVVGFEAGMAWCPDAALSKELRRAFGAIEMEVTDGFRPLVAIYFTSSFLPLDLQDSLAASRSESGDGTNQV